MKIIFVALIISLFLIFPLSIADGMPMPPRQVKTFDFSAVEEKQQYAVVEVLSNYFQQTNMFLSLTSLSGKNENITLIIPFESVPTKMEANKLTSKEFLEKYDFDEVKETAHKQSIYGVVSKTSPQLRDYILDYLTLVIFSPIYKMGIGASAATRGWETMGAMAQVEEYADKNLPEGVELVVTYEFEGGKMDIYNVDSGQTLGDFMRNFYDLYVPENVKEAIDKYGRHYIAVLSLNIEPIADVSLLQQYSPNAFNEVRDYINAHPDFEVKCSVPSYRYYPVETSCNARSQLKTKFSSLIEKAKTEARNSGYMSSSNIEKQLLDFLEATYSGKTKGLELSLTLPMKNQEVYYPLGTGTAWATPIEDTKVLVRMSKELVASLPKAQYESVGEVYRNYLYEYKNWNPDFDVKGGVSNANALTGLGDGWKKLMNSMYENYITISLILLIIVLIGAGFILQQWEYIKRDDLKFLVFGALLSPLISVWALLLLGYALSTKPDFKKLEKNGKIMLKYFIVLFIIYCIVLTIAFFVGG